jgi:Zn-dependent alcohol dehydrogenase
MFQTFAMADGSTRLRRGGEIVHRGLGLAAFADEVIVDERGAIPIPAEVPLDVACVIGCAVQTGVGAVLNTAAVEEGATVLVVGLGGVGLSVVQGARIAGASAVIVSDPIAARRTAALEHGATDALDPAEAELADQVRARTNGVGVDYAFEAVGRSALVEATIGAVRDGGTIVMVGAMPIDDPLTIPVPVWFGATERKLIGCLLGSCSARRDIPRLLDLWQRGRLDLEALVTARRPLAEINDALDALRAGEGIRTVLSY